MADDEKISVMSGRVNKRLTNTGTISLFFLVLFSFINFLTLRLTNLNFLINLLQNYVPLGIISYLIIDIFLKTQNYGIKFFQKIDKKILFEVTLLNCLPILNVLATLPTSKKLSIKCVLFIFIFYIIGFIIVLKGIKSEKKCCVNFSLICFGVILIAPFLLSFHDLWVSKDSMSLIVSISVFSIVFIVGFIRCKIKK